MVYSNVKRLMEEKKKSIRGLSAELSLAPRTILRARGPLIAQCKFATLEKIAAALGVKVSDLYSEVKE